MTCASPAFFTCPKLARAEGKPRAWWALLTALTSFVATKGLALQADLSVGQCSELSAFIAVETIAASALDSSIRPPP